MLSKNENKPRSGLRLLSATCKRFQKEEDGSLTIFSLYIFILMIALGGLATDIMHYDTVQSKLQNTSDRASLAAADLDQTLDSKAVVADYFAKSGMSKYLKDTKVRGGLNWREVEVITEAIIPTYFMFWSSDTKQLTAAADSIATEKVTDIEISLVLDVSGSMNGTKLKRLKTAAGQFFDAVIKNTTDPTLGITSVSVVPYNQSVNVGPLVLDHYNPTSNHTETHCIHFKPADFDKRNVTTTASLDRVAHFAWGDNNNNAIPDYWYECMPYTYLHVLPYSFDKTELKAKVNSLRARGNTAVDVGMKWGTALLDPSARPMVTALTNQAHSASTNENPRKVVNPLLSGRPVAYSNQENLKVIVLMTDGINTNQYDLAPAFKDTMAPVWYSPSRDDYVVKVDTNPNKKRYYYPEKYEFYNNRGKFKSKDYHKNRPSDSYQVSYQHLYGKWAIDDVQDYFFKDAESGGGDTLENAHSESNVMATISENGNDGIADSNLDKICTAAKAKQIVVFTIAFEAPSGAEAVMRKCASSTGHYFDVDGTQITTAFKAIASQINRLRLTQ